MRRSKKAHKEPAYEVFDSGDGSDKKVACLPGTRHLINALREGWTEKNWRVVNSPTILRLMGCCWDTRIPLSVVYE